MFHPMQIKDFRVEHLNIKSNPDYSNNPSENDIKSELKYSFEFEINLNTPSRRRIYINLDINKDNKYFKNNPYRIKIRSGIELLFPKDMDEKNIVKNIEHSGFHLLWTTLRAYIITLTDMFPHGRYILPVMDLTDIQKAFKNGIKEASDNLNNTRIFP